MSGPMKVGNRPEEKTWTKASSQEETWCRITCFYSKRGEVEASYRFREGVRFLGFDFQRDYLTLADAKVKKYKGESETGPADNWETTLTEWHGNLMN
ncbi:hypothetical protein A3848_22335 [Paenibacillus sp. P32E]|nr:hypothetical protein A3848_22335 [Paenibacillus sp. P32E]